VSSAIPNFLLRECSVAHNELRGGQGRTALGIDDQKKKVLDYLNGGKWSLSAAFTEIESGKKGDWPELRKALDHCEKMSPR
jgi:DNA invertase Pin-like site-specific DNA recombinase